MDADKIPAEKLAEMNTSLIADNNYLRGELHAARARLAEQSPSPMHWAGDASAAP